MARGERRRSDRSRLRRVAVSILSIPKEQVFLIRLYSRFNLQRGKP